MLLGNLIRLRHLHFDTLIIIGCINHYNMTSIFPSYALICVCLYRLYQETTTQNHKHSRKQVYQLREMSHTMSRRLVGV